MIKVTFDPTLMVSGVRSVGNAPIGAFTAKVCDESGRLYPSHADYGTLFFRGQGNSPAICLNPIRPGLWLARENFLCDIKLVDLDIVVREVK